MAKYFPKINRYTACNHMFAVYRIDLSNRIASIEQESYGTKPASRLVRTDKPNSCQRALERIRLAGWREPAGRIRARALWHESGLPVSDNRHAGSCQSRKIKITKPACRLAETGKLDSFQRSLARIRLAGFGQPASRFREFYLSTLARNRHAGCPKPAGRIRAREL
ncbi:hypothetical protein WN943_019231 [Citrus x changshan-huyou]